MISGQPRLNPQELQEKASNLPNMSPHEPPTNLQIFSSKQQTQFRKGNKVSPNFSINNQFIKSIISEAGPLNFYPLHCACSSESCFERLEVG
jgi:hypothetical protein